MKYKKYRIKLVFSFLVMVFFLGCEKEARIIPGEGLNPEKEESQDPLDIYLRTTFREPLGSVIIYEFVDRYIRPDRQATPPRKELVRPVAELIQKAWVGPYDLGADDGEAFMRRYFPAEVVMLGSPILNGDGTVTLGIADAGVRVTLTQVNDYTPDNIDWIRQTFRTLHHEFAHIVDQNFNFDDQSFFEISGSDYTSPGSWTGLIEDGEFSKATIDKAIERGMVTAYGTSSVAEDFAELIAYIITTEPAEFEATYITPELCPAGDQVCAARNIGRERLQQKYDRVVAYFKDDVGVDLLKVRDEFLNGIQ